MLGGFNNWQTLRNIAFNLEAVYSKEQQCQGGRWSTAVQPAVTLESIGGRFSPIRVRDLTVMLIKRWVQGFLFFFSTWSLPPLSAPVIMQHDGLMANVLPPLTPRTRWHLFNTTTGRIRERKGRGTARQQWKTARQEDMRVGESLLLSFDQAVGRLKLFPAHWASEAITSDTLCHRHYYIFCKKRKICAWHFHPWNLGKQSLFTPIVFKLFCLFLDFQDCAAAPPSRHTQACSIETAMFYLSRSERDIFSVKRAHVSGEEHCCISAVLRGSETGGHPAAHAEHTRKNMHFDFLE